MSLLAIKYHVCDRDQGEGILLVDLESETIPRTNTQGKKLYYCTYKHHLFAVDDQEIITTTTCQDQTDIQQERCQNNVLILHGPSNNHRNTP